MNYTLYGVALGLLAVALVRVLQTEVGLPESAARWVRAVLIGGAYLLVKNAEALQAMWPPFETVVVQVGGFAAAVLGMLGYWDKVQKAGARIVPTSEN